MEKGKFGLIGRILGNEGEGIEDMEWMDGWFWMAYMWNLGKWVFKGIACFLRRIILFWILCVRVDVVLM